MAIIWDQPPAQKPDKEIEEIIEEAEQAFELLEEIEEEPVKSPSRGFGN
jgi:hypothetical protein